MTSGVNRQVLRQSGVAGAIKDVMAACPESGVSMSGGVLDVGASWALRVSHATAAASGTYPCPPALTEVDVVQDGDIKVPSVGVPLPNG